MIIIDAYSKWPEVFVLQNSNVSKTTEQLNCLFSMYGYSEQVVTDNGPQFVAQYFSIVIHSCGIKHIISASYHPSSGSTPSSLFLKREIRMRFDLLCPDQKSRVREKQAKQKLQHDQHAKVQWEKVIWQRISD